MHCNEIESRLSVFIDDELEPEIRQRVKGHINKCVDCREALKALQRVDRHIKDYPLIRAPEDFSDQVMLRAGKSGSTIKYKQTIRRTIDSAVGFLEDLLDLIKLRQSPTTLTLDEFSDFPPCSLGRAYIKLHP